ncbi:unnamed protein product [Rotaria sp. Silwood1]|nr:unnamed protein product [Rotaria sp. Silwood1]
MLLMIGSIIGSYLYIVVALFGNFNLEQKYAGRVVQQFSPKEKIALEIIKDLRLFVGGSLREFSNHNSRLPNKLVFS